MEDLAKALLLGVYYGLGVVLFVYWLIGKFIVGLLFG